MKWCEDCAVWKGSTVEVRDGRSQVGECRKSAPVGIGMLGEEATTELYAHWPMTLPHDWCGEIVPKEQAA